MSILDKLFGHEEQPRRQDPQPQQQPYPTSAKPPAQTADQQAIARYQYMLKTAPPETIEQAHQEAFAQLSPEQRKQVLQQLSSAVPPSERPPLSAADDPQALARAATRAEVRQPGTLERIFGSSGGPGGGGGMGFGGSLLTGLAGAFVGTAIADHFFRGPMGSGFMGGGMGMGGFGGGGYGGGTVVNETINNYGSDDRDTEDDDRNDRDADNSDDNANDDDSSDDSSDDSGSDSSFDDSADYGDAGGDDSGGGVDI